MHKQTPDKYALYTYAIYTQEKEMLKNTLNIEYNIFPPAMFRNTDIFGLWNAEGSSRIHDYDDFTMTLFAMD